MKKAYPAIFTPIEDGEFAGGYRVYIPDLPVVRTYGKDLEDAIEMAADAASMWIWDAENKGESIPGPSETLSSEPPHFVSMVMADSEAYRRRHDNRSVKKTLTIPAWLNHKAEEAHLNFSGILQEALKSHLQTRA